MQILNIISVIAVSDEHHRILTLRVQTSGYRSLALDVAPHTGKIIKNGPRCVFLKEEKICNKMVYYTLYFGQLPIVRIKLQS